MLRGEWGYTGLVVSDWGAVNDRVKGLAAGMDLEMPSSGGATDAQIVDAVKNGTIDESILDTAVARVLELADLRRLCMPFAGLVFFADAGNGDQFALSLSGNHEVYVWNHEDDSRMWVATTVTRYLQAPGPARFASFASVRPAAGTRGPIPVLPAG